MTIHGSQRLSMEALAAWERLGYGMFIHFGMSTYLGMEIPVGNESTALYSPTRLDVAQWVSVARDAGMKYAVLCAKHVAGHCLWPSRYTDYSVANSPVKTDLVEQFVNECRAKGIMPGLYYCSWDNHHKFGSQTPTDVVRQDAQSRLACSFTTREYQEFQTNQISELLTCYGAIGELWIDIPWVLPRCYREELYHLAASLQPEMAIMMNNGIGDSVIYCEERAWPSDLMAIERFVPESVNHHKAWRHIEGKDYYIPGEVCDTIGKEWFFQEGDKPRCDKELLAMYLLARVRGANFLLNVPPDKGGLIPASYVDSLMRLRRNIELSGGFF